MEIYVKIFEVIFPVFFVIGIGYYLGKKNEPSFIKFTAQKLSEIKGIQYSKLVENTTKNFNNLFSIN